MKEKPADKNNNNNLKKNKDNIINNNNIINISQDIKELNLINYIQKFYFCLFLKNIFI